MTGGDYLGGFFRFKAGQDIWLGDNVEGWQDSVATLDGVAHQHLQTAYTGLQNSLQQEWEFVQCVIPYIGMAFQVVKDALWYIFLPDLF